MKKFTAKLLSILLVFSLLFVDGSFALYAFAESAYYGLFSDEQSDGGFEYGGWQDQSIAQKSSWKTVTDEYHRGSKSAEFNFESGGGYKELYIHMDVPADTVEEIKTYKDYCWTAYVKTSTDFMGSVSLKLVAEGEYTAAGLMNNVSQDEVQVYNHSSNGRISEWTRFDAESFYYNAADIEAFLADKTTFSVVLKVRGAQGTVWLDDIDFKRVDRLDADETAPEEITYGDFEGNLNNSGFEGSNWTVAKQTDQTVTLDTSNGHGGSKTALKVGLVERKSSYSSAINFTTSTIAGVAEELDTTKNYRAAIWVKNSEDFEGSISFQVSQNGSKKWYNWQTELHLIGNNTTAASGYTDWTYLYTPNFTVTNHDITVTLIVNGVGTIWFDDARIILDPEADNIFSNGGFENGVWSTWGSDNLETETVEAVTDETYGTAKAAKITITEALDAATFIVGSANMSKFNPARTYDLSFAMKYEDVEETDGIRCAIQQWYNVENADGTVSSTSTWYRYYGSEQLLKTGGGSQDWTEYNLALPTYGWQDGITSFVIYFYLMDKGELWIDSVNMIERKRDLNIADGVVASDTPDGELKAGTSVQLYTNNSSEDIWYTVDGSDPRTSKTAFLFKDGMGVLITEDITVKASAKNAETGFGVISEFNYTCPTGLIPEDTLWSTANVSDAVSLDTANKKVGNNSIKLTGSSDSRYISTGEIPITSAFDHKLSFWVKTENLVDGARAEVNVFLTSPTGAGNRSHPFITGVRGTSVGNYGSSYFEIEANQDWTYYELDLHTLNGLFSDVTVTLYNNRGYGTIWIDGVTLTSVPQAYYPVSVEYDAAVHGNIYAQSTSSDFIIEQSFNIENIANTNETGIMHYEVVNDLTPDEILTSGEFEVDIASDIKTASSIDLSAVTEYGTYTVIFTMENTQGAVYPAGEIKLSRVLDNTDLMENGGTYLGVTGTPPNSQWATSHNYVGNSMMRFDYDWTDVEKEKGVYTIHETKDLCITTMIENNIEPLIIFNTHGWPSWMEQRGWPTTDSDLEHFLGYVRFLVETYKGKVKYFEFYNEVDYRHWASPSEYPDAVGYTETMKEVYKVVKEANPEAILIGGVTASTDTSGVNLGWARTMFENGAADYMDYYSIHPYVKPMSPESGNWLEDIQNLNAMTKQVTGEEFPLFITEMGWATARTSDIGETPQKSLEYSIRAYTMGTSLSNLEKIVTYCVGSGTNIYYTENQFGMFGSASYAMPLAVGRAAFNYMHNGFKYDSTADLAQGLYVYKYSGETEDMYVLWTDDVEDLAQITTSCNNARVYDIYGNLLNIEYVDNTFEAQVGPRVIYVRLDKGETIESVALTDIPQDILTDALLTNASLETKPSFWSDDSASTIDKLNRYDGNASLKINFFKGSDSATTFVLGISQAKMAELDSSVNYKLIFYAKSDGNYDGGLLVDPRYYSNGKEFFGCYWTWGGDYPILNTGTIPETWTAYETEPFPLIGDSVTLLVSINNKVALSDATVWFDRFEIVPVEENTSNGTIKVSYNTELDRVIATVTGKNGYVPSGLTARGATNAGANNYVTVESSYYAQTDVNQISYSVDFGSCNRYYQGQSFRVFEASYTKLPEADDPSIVLGDATGDGNVDLLDMVRFKNYELGNTYDIVYLNVWFDRSDSTLGATDFAALRKHIWNSY